MLKYKWISLRAGLLLTLAAGAQPRELTEVAAHLQTDRISLRYACTSVSPEYIAGFYLMSAARTGNTLFLAAFCPYFRKEIGSIMLSGLKIIYTNV